MNLKRVTVAAAAISPWIPLNRRSWGSVGFTVNPQNSAAGTYDVEFTESNLNTVLDFTPISRSTTVLTVSLVNHGLIVGDDVIVAGSIDYDGEQTVASVVDADSFTITVAASGTARKAKIIPIIADDLTGFTAATGKNSGEIDASVVAIRLNCTNSTTAAHDIFINQFES